MTQELLGDKQQPLPPGGTNNTSPQEVADWLRRALPKLGVVLALAALAAWGHHSGWKIPTSAALTGHNPPLDKDWCEEHNVPETQCVECNPDLLPKDKDYGWCPKHGIPECPLDHPDLAQVAGPPHLPRYDVAAALSLLDRPENNSKCRLHQRRIQFASAAAADKAGVEPAFVEERPMTEYVAASGEIAYDQTRVARLAARVPGSVWRVEKEVGQPVRKGEVLALVDAAEVGRAKTEFLQAFALVELKADILDRSKDVYAKGALPESKFREAEAGLREARIGLLGAQEKLVNLGLPPRPDDLKGSGPDEITRRIRFLGLTEAVTAGLDPQTTTANLYPVRSPIDGIVVAREAVAGEVVDVVRTLLVVADTSRMWVTLSVRLEDANHLAEGQVVRFRADGAAEEASGRLAWISTAADEKTRTLKVRADLDNPSGHLRANTFGLGRIVLREERYAVTVPNEAVHWDGDCTVVFVRDKHYQEDGAPKVFHVRKVRLGTRNEGFTEVLAGVLPGEVVAAKGSAVLLAELLKGNIGENGN